MLDALMRECIKEDLSDTAAYCWCGVVSGELLTKYGSTLIFFLLPAL